MSWIAKLFSAGTGDFISTVGSVADKFITTQEDKMRFMVEFEQVLQRRDSEIEQTLRAEMTAKAQIIVAEMASGDNYTKRARPTVVYFGLWAIFFNYMFIPLVQMVSGMQVAAFDLPTEFWLAWGGIVGTWSLGRSAEKMGKANRGTEMLTGSSNSGIMKTLLS